jgi:hypothetical protein
MRGLQPLSRIAGEGDDQRITVRGEAGEGSFVANHSVPFITVVSLD